MKIISNVVPKEKVREVQLSVLEELANYLTNSFGPNGSNSCIQPKDGPAKYSKDGHTILSGIHYHGAIEYSIKNDIENITRYITKTVGDGTTSAVILSYLIFNELHKLESNYKPIELTNAFKDAVNSIKKDIKTHTNKPAFLMNDNYKAIYDISMVSTNGNSEVSNNIRDIYKEFGLDVFIDVTKSLSELSAIKVYDGLVMNAGIYDKFLSNDEDKSKDICTVENANVYVFVDPIDTPEMMSFFERIINNNIVMPWDDRNMENLTPTVIFAKKISKDLSPMLSRIGTFMDRIPNAQKPPLLIVDTIIDDDALNDLCILTDTKPIRKYMDMNLQLHDIESGLAPTIDTVCEHFCGYAGKVVADLDITKVYGAKKMYEEDGITFSETYNSLIGFIENTLEKAIQEGETALVTGRLKRRLRALKGCMVDYLVGGATPADRDAVCDLVEDAILNCRSASVNGYGRGANFEGLYYSYKNFNNSKYEDCSEIKSRMYEVIYTSYSELIKILYGESKSSNYLRSLQSGHEIKPDNLFKDANFEIISSIESDIVILDIISKIVTLMFTCNQFVLPNALNNVYMA